MNLEVKYKAFWIVVSEVSGMSFQPYRHESQEAAFIEAERLAKSHAGNFLVFECKGYSRRNDVATTKFDDIPF